MAAGKKLLNTRPTERAGVRAVGKIFEDANFTFQEVDRGIDIGKDAYVDLQEPSGLMSGAMVALQIKSGPSYRHNDDYKVDCTANDRAVWAGSPVPVFGMVYDQDADTVHWVDLTAWARELSPGETSSYCVVPRQNLLNEHTLPFWTEGVLRQLKAQADPPALRLMSEDPQMQRAAISDCFALGRHDARPLKLLRASLRWLADVDATWPAIYVLSLVTAHPDLVSGTTNWLEPRVRDEVSKTFTWSVEETELLVRAPAFGMWARGELGQGVYYLLACDPDIAQKLEAVIIFTDHPEVRFQAARVRVAMAGADGLSVFDRLTNDTPALAADEMWTGLRGPLAEQGRAPLF